jgi:hypothetical protein
MLNFRVSGAPEAGRLREAAGQLRRRAQSAAEDAQRAQLLALAEYYDDMAADMVPPVPPALAAVAPAA